MRPLRAAALGCLAGLIVLVLFVPPASAFPDVPNHHRHARAINELAQLGIVSGKGDGTFRPDDPVFRAQFAKMICGLLGIEVTEDQSFAPFTDLGPDDPHDLYPHEYVGAAYQAGITKGKTATTFSPYTNITLPQVVTMVVRAADAYYPGLLPAPPRTWFGLWADGDVTHGANVRRADYTDLLAFIPTEHLWTTAWRPATRGEVSQIMVNLRAKLQDLGIAVSFAGNALDLGGPLCIAGNRYYLPLVGLVKSIGGTASRQGDFYHIEVNDLRITLNAKDGRYSVNGTSGRLRKTPIVRQDTVHVSLFDLQKMLRLKVAWDGERRTIALFWNRDAVAEQKQPPGGKTALVRFEDVTAAQRYSTAESLEQLRIVFDHCHARGIPMSLGWVPRYIDPVNGIDNALADDYTMHNANFVYTLDYFVDRGGSVGLHGYTHQYGTEVSIYGTEFNYERHTTESSIRKRLGYAIDDAKKLDIPITFFESPHYAATTYQKQIMAEYFDILYEHRLSWTEKNISKVKVGGRTVTFIPTPLDYVFGAGGADNMIAKMRALKDGELASFFYHPNIEFGSIWLGTEADGYPAYTYATDSPLRRILDAFIQQGYTFRAITSL